MLLAIAVILFVIAGFLWGWAFNDKFNERRNAQMQSVSTTMPFTYYSTTSPVTTTSASNATYTLTSDFVVNKDEPPLDEDG